MSESTIFIKHKDYIIKENDKYLNKSYKTKELAEKQIQELQKLNPENEYGLICLKNDINDLKMRIVSFLEDYCLPNYLIMKDGKVIKKYHYDFLAEEKIEEFKENVPNIDLEIIKVGEKRPYPKYVSLLKTDYELLKKTNNIRLEDNTEKIWGMEIKVFIPKKKGKNGKASF